MSEIKGAAKSAFLIMAITLASKILGFLRETTIAAGFGASSETDAYVVALTIPAVLFASFSRALQTSFIPVFNELLFQKENTKAFAFTANLINVVVITALLVSSLAYFLMPEITRIIAPGFQGPVYRLTIELARLMLPVGAVWGLVGIASGVLNSMNIFSVPAAVGIVYNLAIITSVMTIGSWWGIQGLAAGTAIGVLGQFIIQIPWLKKTGLNWGPYLSINNPSMRKMGILVLPVLASSVVVQLNVVVDRILASRLPEGSIAALNFANRLNGFVLGVFVMALVTVIFPSLSQKAAAGEMADFQKILCLGMKIIAYLTLPAMTIILVMKVPVIRVLFQRGAFDIQDTQMTATAFLFYGVGLAAFGLREIINVAFYALQDTRTPMMAGIGSLLLNIILNLILIRPMAHGGLALATSLACISYVFFMVYLLDRKLQGIGLKEMAVSFIRMAGASLAMGIAMEGVRRLTCSSAGIGWFWDASLLALDIAIGGVVYIIFSLVLKVEEAGLIYQLIRGRLARKT